MDDLIVYTERKLADYSVELDWFQSNGEGHIVDRIHLAIGEGVDGIVINPGGYSHTSVAIHDALEMFSGPVVEVHLTNTIRREGFRGRKITARAADGILEGHGKNSYILGIFSLILSGD